MKIYVILALLFVVAFVAGCTESGPVDGGNVQTQDNAQTSGNGEQTQASTINEQTTTTEPPVTEPVPPIAEPSGISLSELAVHNERADCWVGYKGKVYDITDFVPKHPGGASKIMPYCGTASEFEKAFTKQHGTSQVGELVKEGTLMGDLQ